MKKILVIRDFKIGHYNQTDGIVKAFEKLFPCEVKIIQVKLRMKVLRKVLNLLLNTQWIRGLLQHSDSLTYLKYFYKGVSTKEQLGNYDFVVSTGGDTSFINAWVALATDARNFLNGRPRNLDSNLFTSIFLVIDLGFPNQIVLNVAPTIITKEDKEETGAFFTEYQLDKKKRYFVLLIGGDGSGYHYNKNDIKALIKGVNYTSQTLGISWLVTTSRRTKIEYEDLMERELKSALFIAYNKNPKNVVKKFLAVGEAIFVTEDSGSMISEGISSKKPIFTLYPQKMYPDQNYRTLLKKFVDEKRIKRILMSQFNSEMLDFNDFEMIKDDSYIEISKKIKGMI